MIDEAATTYDVRELSLGDFVLNGGEVAAAAFIEAVVRLLPGFMGNPESLAEESHEDGLLEYPVYTKPASWRGRDVPEVLLSGDHGAIAAWRHAESVRRTVARRPDLAHPAASVGLGGLDLEIRLATRADAGELFTLTRACWLQELWANPGVVDPGAGGVVRGLPSGASTSGRRTSRVAGGRIVGSTRGRLAGDGTVWDVGRVMVAPDLQGRGLGRSPPRAGRGRRARRGHVVRAVDRRPERRQHPDVQEGRLPAPGPGAGPAGRRGDDQAPLRRSISRWPVPVWQT